MNRILVCVELASQLREVGVAIGGMEALTHVVLNDELRIRTGRAFGLQRNLPAASL